MRQTKEVLKAENERLQDELNSAIYALRALTRQAADRELLAAAHNEPITGGTLGSVTVTEWAQRLLKKYDQGEKVDVE